MVPAIPFHPRYWAPYWSPVVICQYWARVLVNGGGRLVLLTARKLSCADACWTGVPKTTRPRAAPRVSFSACDFFMNHSCNKDELPQRRPAQYTPTTLHLVFRHRSRR